MATFGDLKNLVLKRAGTSNHFDFIEISEAHRDFWDKLNTIEFDRGYVPGEYEKSGTPALRQMDLLTDEEFQALVKEYEALPQR